MADNAWSENKNIWIFALMCLLVHFGWFKEIVIGMLVVGHTHDFDDAGLFGHVQPRIKFVTTTGLFDMIAQLKAIWSSLVLLRVVPGVGLTIAHLDGCRSKPRKEGQADKRTMHGTPTFVWINKLPRWKVVSSTQFRCLWRSIKGSVSVVSTQSTTSHNEYALATST
jgi:hypothetical protein